MLSAAAVARGSGNLEVNVTPAEVQKSWFLLEGLFFFVSVFLPWFGEDRDGTILT